MQSGLAVKAARFGIVLALFAIWEMLSRTGIVNPRLLPSASDTLVTLAEEGTIRAPLFRAIAKHVLGYDATQRAHLLGLAGKFSSEKPVLQRAR